MNINGGRVYRVSDLRGISGSGIIVYEKGSWVGKVGVLGRLNVLNINGMETGMWIKRLILGKG